MHKAKANISHSDMASSGPKTPILPTEYIGRIETPFGVQYVNRGDSLDHAYMCSKQLRALLATIHGEGLDRFLRLDEESQHQLMWLALQLSEQTVAMVDVVARDIREGVSMATS